MVVVVDKELDFVEKCEKICLNTETKLVMARNVGLIGIICANNNTKNGVSELIIFDIMNFNQV